MSRFNNKFRKRLPNRICNHFDKYIQFINPVDFNLFDDVYRPHWPDHLWSAMTTLVDSKEFTTVVNRTSQFKLYVSDDSHKSEWQRDYVQFAFPNGKRYPHRDIELIKQPEHVQARVRTWVSKGLALRKLRGELYNRITALLDWGWDPAGRYDSYNSRWTGAPTPGWGCNTMGQVNRIWPELVAFFPVEEISTVRNANQKSRLPHFIRGYGTPAMFTCDERPAHEVSLEVEEDSSGKPFFKVKSERPYTDEEWAFAKRKFAAINHILIQMSLMKDVPHVDNYPDIHVGS